MAPDGDRTLGELGRAIDQLTRAIQELHKKIDALPERFLPRGEWELAQGANRIDIGKVENDIHNLTMLVRDIQHDAAAKFRQIVLVGVSAFVAPLVVWAMTVAMQR